ncbi:MAG: phospholipase D-like domain-containing protein [Candidatus Algichlamydia australiensis]|nr:phospholipase D-like domain-containing protein [Chlamydiales bacterium]
MKRILPLILSFGVLFGTPQVFFSPQDNLADRLIELIQKEEKSIRIAIYFITNRQIAKELIEAKKRGVHVEMICDPGTYKEKSAAQYLKENGVLVSLFDPEKGAKYKKGKPIMHNKFAIFERNSDQKPLLWTGSFNFTYAATNKNKENALVIDDLDTIHFFEKEFDEIKTKYTAAPK